MIVGFDAAWLARGWLAVGLASRPNKDLAMLDRALHVELYDYGARLVATDQVVLLHAWVPAFGKEDEAPPTLDDAPAETVTVYDWYGRAAGLFKHLLSVATDEAAAPFEVTLSAGDESRADGLDGLLSFAGMERRQVSIMAPGRELLMLDTFEGDWPNWRSLTLRHTPRRTGAIALDCGVVARLAKLGALYDDEPLRWYFGGVDKMAAVEIGAAPRVEGVVMPVRVTFDERHADA